MLEECCTTQRALQNDALVGSMISADGRTAIVLAEMESMDDIDTARTDHKQIWLIEH